jgi:hypothetical protein
MIALKCAKFVSGPDFLMVCEHVFWVGDMTDAERGQLSRSGAGPVTSRQGRPYSMGSSTKLFIPTLSRVNTSSETARLSLSRHHLDVTLSPFPISFRPPKSCPKIPFHLHKCKHGNNDSHIARPKRTACFLLRHLIVRGYHACIDCPCDRHHRASATRRYQKEPQCNVICVPIASAD